MCLSLVEAVCWVGVSICGMWNDHYNEERVEVGERVELGVRT